MDKIKKILRHIFIDGLSGMALGLFATLIIGTILAQVGSYVHGSAGTCISAVATAAKTLMGAGIAVGVTDHTCRCVSACVCFRRNGRYGRFICNNNS